MLKSTKMVFFVLFLCLIFIAYLDTDSYNALGKSPANIPTFSDTQANTTITQTPSLEDKLVDTKLVDGYTVETYQEFEIYKDKNGNIEKVVPTSHFDYLRYKSDE
jgi:hypothetical protein